MKPDTNYLGQFLKALRESRGFENIREYVRDYNLPVGYVYYTEIESGKKYLGLDTARQLCEALKVDILTFYSQLLKDILPAEIQEDFLNLIPLSKTVDPQASATKKEALREAYQRNLLSRINLTTNAMTKEAEVFFFENPDLMPLVAAIYCTESTTEQALEQTAQRIGVTMPVAEIVDNFEKFGIARVTTGPNQSKVISRLCDIIMTHDKRTAAHRLNAETLQTLEDMDGGIIPDPNASNCFYGIVGLSKQKQEEVARLIADLRAEFDSYHHPSAEQLQLMTVAFTPIKQYTPQSSPE